MGTSTFNLWFPVIHKTTYDPNIITKFNNVCTSIPVPQSNQILTIGSITYYIAHLRRLKSQAFIC